MKSSDAAHRGGRETRLLLATIAVSIGVLLLLSRFRFPEQAAEPLSVPNVAPLERLAARAAYDELASTMADLERRLSGAVVVLRVDPQQRESGAFVVAPRLTADRGVTLISPGETLPGDTGGTSRIISSDLARQLAVVSLSPNPSAIVTPRSGPPRPGPRYVVAVEGTADGLTVRPVYVGRSAMLHDERTSTPLLSLSGVQNPVSRGAAIFSLDGIFIGLVVEAGLTTIVMPGDFLQTAAEAAVATTEKPPARLGIEVAPLSDALMRAASASGGVIVTNIEEAGPSAGLILPGDVVQSIDGTAVTGVGAFRQLERARTPAQNVVLSIVRRRSPQNITVRAADARVASQPAGSEVPGIVARSIPGTGLEVVTVTPGSAADLAGLMRGDMIVTIDGQPVDRLAGLTRDFRKAAPATAWILTVRRGDASHALALEKR